MARLLMITLLPDHDEGACLEFDTTDTAVVDKPTDEEGHGHHHGHAH